jgi:hypothetical protein
MLEVKYTDDMGVLAPLYKTLGISGEVSGMNAVLYEDNAALGLCQMKLTDDIEITQFALTLSANTFAVTDFFFRVILFKLSKTSMIIKIKGADERLLKFGFQKDGGYMKVAAESIQFPSQCGGHH